MTDARILFAASALIVGCYTGGGPEVPNPSYARFRTEVYPLVLRDCAFNECHGNPERYYQIFGPGRTRLDVDADLLGDATDEEIDESYDRARAMLLTRSGDIMGSPFLRKPLEGGGHAGLELDGRNVYSSPDDPDYRVLVEWAQGVEGEES